MIQLVDTSQEPESPQPQTNDIRVVWDHEKQTVGLDFDPRTHRTWDWVIGLLQMAVEKAKEMAQLTKAASFQQQQRAAFEHEAIRRNLNGSH